MSIIGNAVTLGGGSGEPELLWTNPDPTASFASQNVAVSGDYDGYIVEFRFNAENTNSGRQTRQMYVPNPLITTETRPFYLSGTFASAEIVTYRVINSVENGVLAFGPAKWAFTSVQQNNTYCIPTRIWGVKWTI